MTERKHYLSRLAWIAAIVAMSYVSSAHADDATDASLRAVEKAQSYQDTTQDNVQGAIHDSAQDDAQHAASDDKSGMDARFDEASKAAQTGEYQQAIENYEVMLSRDPELHRVRLDYALALFRVGRFQDAKKNFEIVLEKNIPDTVRRNVEQVMAQVEQASKVHYFSGMVATGFNFDSNANSAPESDYVTVLEQNFKLANKDQARHDGQAMAMVSINHRWQPMGTPSATKDAQGNKKGQGAKTSPLAWNSSLTAYKSRQQDLRSLDVAMYNLRSGPEYRLADGKVTLGATGGFSQVTLAGMSFLRSYAGDVSVAYAWDERHQVNAVYTEEFRDFMNSDTTTTFEDRQGQAMQGKIGFNYLLTPKDILSLGLMVRNENARKDFYDNLSWSPSIGYTHQWDDESFVQLSLSYKDAKFSDPDPFVSERLREDKEIVAGVMLGKALTDNVSLMVGYQYRSINSTIQNYQNANHHFSSMLAVKF
jgi:tetratricopeptide (TPR) repeat protein